MSVRDIEMFEGALLFTHHRNYDNLEQLNQDGLNGFGWKTPPSIKTEYHPGFYYRTTFAADDTVNFNLTADSLGIYRAEKDFPDTMKIDTVNKTFVVTRSDLSVWTFSNDPNGTVPQGLLKTVLATNGDATELLYTNGHLAKIRAFRTSNSAQTLAELVYAYDTNGRISQIVRNILVGNVLQPEKRVTYTYHTGSDTFGNSGDLKTAIAEICQNGTWGAAETYHYRYYKSGDSKGQVHALKMAIFPAEFALFAAVYGNPACLSVADTTALGYSTKYYEYGSKQRVILERVNRNRKVISFEYTEYPDNKDFNAVHRKTVETRPHGNKNIVFTNYQGNVLLREEVPPVGSVEPSSIQFFQYNADGHRSHDYSPKAVLGYSVKAGTPTTLTMTLAANDGKIEFREYGNGTNAPKSTVIRESIKKGTAGTAIVLQEYAYEKRQIDNRVAWKKTKDTQYAGETQNQAVVTQYAYQYHTNSLEVSQKTTTLPAVSTANNGNGVAATRVERFDEKGRLIWAKDELGVLIYHQYDAITGLRLKTIVDVDTTKTADFVNLPSGWATVSSAGKHLVSEYEYDSQRRLTQTLGPKNTSVNTFNQSIDVRAVSWIVYDDINRKTVSASGYATLNTTGTITGYTLVNPVSITIRDTSDNVTDQIQAARTSTSGKLQATDAFVQSSYTEWTKNIYTGNDLTTTRQYFVIPTSGNGTKDVNYHETTYGYDTFGYQNQVTSPDGTITKNILDWRDLVIKTQVGTSSSNLVPVSETVYGSVGECATCTGKQANPRLVIQYVDASKMRTTEFGYDWRGRRIHVHGEEDAGGNSIYALATYDNMDRVIKDERFLATTPDRLLARTEQFYDERGRVWKTVQSIIDPATGNVSGKMQSLTWFDAAGRVIKSQELGENHFTKNIYDSLGQVLKSYVATNPSESGYVAASSLTGNTVFQQSEITYDNIGNAILSSVAERKINQTVTGVLTLTFARYQFTASWFDPMGRQIATANYGTNNDTTLIRPATVPARSDNVLVTEMFYDANTGRAYRTVDPTAKDHRMFFDALGRTTKTITNYVNGTPVAGTPDKDVTVEMTYHPSGQVATMTAKNATTGDQITRYVYGTSKTSVAPIIYRNDVLVCEMYPDSDDLENSSGVLQNGPDGIADRVEFQYNRIGEQIQRKDQNGTVHAYEFDNLGRILHDRVTTLGFGVDGAVRRISTAYDVIGNVKSITSYNNATVGTGTVVNEVMYEYDANAMLAKEYQNPSGAVNVVTTLYTGYNYSVTKSGDFFTRRLRPTSMRYPGGTTLSYTCGALNSLDDLLNRLTRISYTADIVEYTHTGLANPAIVNYLQPNLKLDYTASGALDRFNRIIDHAWKNASGTDIVRIKHGYDRVGNRLYREDVAAANAGKSFDELYTYDGINQLIDMQRGKLNANKNGIASGKNYEDNFAFDATGNWTTYKQDTTGAGFTLTQTRTHNKANEIATIAVASTHVSHDANGNMTKCVKPVGWNTSYELVYDAWNRLVQVTGTTVARYFYDGLNRRVKTAIGSDTPRIHYFNSNWQCVEEFADGGGSTARYFWGIRYVDDLVMYRKSSIDYLPLPDPNWNATAVVNISGAVLERYTYSAFGKTDYFDASFVPRTGTTVDITRTFTGQVIDHETGLMLYRNRVYHATLGRFIQRDPIGYDGSDFNLFKYCMNNPIVSLDTEGLFTSLAGCFKHIATFCACISTGCFSPAKLASLYTGKGKGAALVNTLTKFGGIVVSGGKGSHSKIILNGRTLIVPQSPGSGTAASIIKDLFDILC